MSAQATVAGTVSTAVVRSLISAARKHGSQRVIGLRAVPDPGAERRFADSGEPVHILPCVSSLAIRDALRNRASEEWLVILTDRPEEDLGAGILGHFANQRLQTPGAWEALKERFGADRLDRTLSTLKRGLPVAQGLLRITPDEGWPVAPGAVLSIDHAFGSVAERQLALQRGPVDALSVLDWTTRSDAADRMADLREFGGNELADAVLQWLADCAGRASKPLLRLLLSGRTADAIPIGIALHVLTGTAGRTPQDQQLTQLALARLEHLWAGSGEAVTPAMVATLGTVSRSVVEALLDDSARWQEGHGALQAADRLLGKIQASSLGRDSPLLPTGLTALLHRLSDTLRSFPSSGIAAVEEAWARVEAHRLAYPPGGNPQDPRVGPFRAAVRLARWLNGDDRLPESFAAAVKLHAHEHAWVDAAYNDAAGGVSDQLLGEGLGAILRLTQQRRHGHDRAFARLLAASTASDEGRTTGRLDGAGDRVWHLERLLPSVVLPLARAKNTLLLVLDGMSAASAAELASTVLHGNEGWAEVIPAAAERRGSAVAVLPTLTNLSRTSLFSGELTSGGQSRELSGFAAVAKAGGIAHSVLFHKAPLDSSRPGLALQDDIAVAIADQQTQLVACVLNTIDDALDKSDPAGTTWTPETIRHLRPLLSAAMAAGRTVVMTSDHGHIVERRRGELRAFGETSSARSRTPEPAAGDDEVLVQGRRVLAEGGRAVLAVDETLRYGPVKAGYHGGASPAEVVVPVVTLVPGDNVPDGWKLAPSQEPLWWSVAASGAAVRPASPAAGLTKAAKDNTPSMLDNFDSPDPVPAAPGIGAAVVSSGTFKAQKAIAGRLAVADNHVVALLDALAAVPGTRLVKETAAVVLQVAPARMDGAVAQLQKLLNVEGYGVLRVDGSMLVLDARLLREQFGVTDRG
ncbi:BREX-2 system phosphatase PglZ [Pseudarthrobacter sp. NBSH8]|uniref:BREX-2 system phosphatase PglZ n=1 Tax=Pseudarthrobacter sp. NBSH8 TaxID=2596911 RepID=UPI00162A2629|nr:BREX-2 system phosphatase PglZ [Pseudarthrobacter sp. NBSH8]